MKHTNTIPANDGWKTDLYDSIIDAIDRLKDKIDPEGENKDFQQAFDDFESDLQEEIKVVTIKAKDVVNEDDFVYDFMHLIEDDNLAGECELAIMESILETNGYGVVKTDSLAEVMRFEAFKEELQANPYQLKLIA